MKNTFLIIFALSAQLGLAGNTSIYDVINGRELIFTATSRYEKLAIDELNPVEEVGYSFFTFLNEEYEEQRIEKIHNRFKKRPLEASFQQLADSLGQMRFKAYVSENNYYRNPDYQGYVVEDIDLRPISYLGHTLTFSFSAKLQLQGLQNMSFTVEEVYFLNLSDFSILPARAIHQSINYTALRIALQKKWQEIQGEMPRKNWAPLQTKVDNQEELYEEEYEELEPETYFTDSLISYAIQSADLRKTEIIYTGAGVLVVLHDAIPWFKSQYETPLQVQLHLNAHEVKEALRNFEPYAAIQNAVETKPGKLPVDPYDFFQEAKFLNLSRPPLDFLRLNDTDISAIERYYKNNPTDSQYLHQINYTNGRATLITGRAQGDIPTYDSIFWEDDKVQAVISQKSNRNYDEGSGYEAKRYLQLQARDEYGNTKWYLSTEHSFHIQHYCYFEDKLARYNYPILSAGGIRGHYDQKPYWYEIVYNGICIENGQCAKVDKQRRPVVEFNEYYAYENDRLVQILGDRENSTLFYYDESGRLSEVLQTERSPQKTLYFYKGDSNLPYRIENNRPNQSHPQNFYQVIHRR